VGKIVKSVAIAAALVGLAIVTGGVSLVPTFTAGSFVSVTAAGAAMLAMAATTVLSGVAQQFFGPRAPKTQLSRLNVSLDPITPRKSVFGTTAMNLDLRYHESSGADQEFIDYIIAVAAHKVASIDEIWFEEKQAWTATGGVTTTYTGYLTVTTRTEGTAGNTIAINGGAKWGSSRRLTGCAYLHIRIKRTGNTKKAESPLVNGLPSRVTIIGNGALLYDPRKDSTVAGGSGSHRSNDQTTWGVYTDADDCDNPALQLLWWLLGWKINGKLSVGCGVPANRLDMASFITAANICDESVILATGGTQKRYRTSGTASDADSRMDIINTFLMSMNGTLRDNSGKLTLTVMKNDLGEYVLDLDEADMLGEFDWQQTRGLTENYNVARGRYVDPSYTSLYQMVDYPEVGFASSDGIERATTIDLAYVEDGRRAQRIAKQILQRNQYRGMFSATFNAKALGCQVGDVVRLSIEALGWANKPFRVISQEIRFDGQVPLALVEENAAIYAWDREDSAPVTPTAPTIYDPLNAPFILGIDQALDAALSAQATADGKIESFYQPTMPTTGTEGDLWIDTDDGNKLYRHNGITFIEIQDDGINAAIVAASDAQATADGKVTTFASTSAPTAEGVGDLWVDTDDSNKLYRWSGSAWVSVRDAGIAAAAALANDAQATADGKVQTFYQASAPTAEGIGDLWFDTDDGNKQYRWSGSAWVAVQDAGIGIAISDAAGAQATADGKVTTFYTTSAPTAEGVGDLWFDTDDSNKLYRWSGSAWVSARDAGIAQALTDAANAQASADGKIESFYQSSMPSGASSGDLWIDTDDGNKLYRHNGTTFIEVQDDAISTAIAAASDAQATADGKVTTFVGTTAPTAEAVGDLWIDTDDNNKLYRWSGSAWVLVRDLGIAQALADVAAAQAEIDIISSDNWLSAAEKPTLKVVYDALISNYTALDAKAAALGVASTERTNATSAINALNSFLSGLTPSWTDTTQDTPWTGATANTRFDDAHEKVAILQAAVQGLPGADGVDTITGLLTNEAVTLSADSSGVVASFTPANGTFKVFQGTTDVTTSSAFTVASSSNCTVSIGGSTGIYSVSAMSADTASATFQAVYSGVTIQKVLSLSKSRTGTPGADGTDGTDGTDGVNGNKFVPIFKRSATLPATPTGNLTPAGWSTSIPAVNGQPAWRSDGEISGASTLVGSWTTPVLFEAVAPSPASQTILITAQTQTTSAITISLDNGESRSIDARVRVAGLSSSTTQNVKIEWREIGGTYAQLGSVGSDSGGAGDTVFAIALETLTNSSGIPKAYEIRAVASKSGGTGTIDQASSYLKA
jgi:hypothetical protein